MPDDVAKLFNFMDGNGDGTVNLNEMKMLLDGTQESIKDRLKSFSPEFESHMMREIQKNFELLDKDNNKSLTA